MANETALNNVIGKACHRYKNVLICDDLNHRTIEWDRLQCDSESQKFSDITLDWFLHQHINKLNSALKKYILREKEGIIIISLFGAPKT